MGGWQYLTLIGVGWAVSPHSIEGQVPLPAVIYKCSRKINIENTCLFSYKLQMCNQLCRVNIEGCISDLKDLMDQQLTSAVNSSSSSQSPSRNKICCPTFKFAAPMSILLWNFLVQMGYSGIVYGSAVMIFNSLINRDFGVVVNSLIGAYGLIGLTFMLYPIGGLIADLRYGRYKVIKLSLINNWVGAIIMSVLGVLLSAKVYSHALALKVANSVGVILLAVLFGLGIGGFQSNAVQFGLDQLLDASSEELSLFLHWFVWTEHVGELISRLSAAEFYCRKLDTENIIVDSSGLLYLALSTGCLVLVCCKRRWFNCENVVGNPYQNVYRVLKFTAKHGKPLGHRRFAVLSLTLMM